MPTMTLSGHLVSPETVNVWKLLSKDRMPVVVEPIKIPQSKAATPKNASAPNSCVTHSSELRPAVQFGPADFVPELMYVQEH